MSLYFKLYFENIHPTHIVYKLFKYLTIKFTMLLQKYNKYYTIQQTLQKY